LGFIAQELKEVFPELVYQETDSSEYSINYIGLIPILVEALKEQQILIEELQQKLSMQSLKSAVITTDDEKMESTSKLFQNIPNPFQKNTQIGYYLPEAVQNAKIMIYDMQGNYKLNFEIADRGNSMISINNADLNPGFIYLCFGSRRAFDRYQKNDHNRVAMRFLTGLIFVTYKLSIFRIV
jgi:hypothetical protein